METNIVKIQEEVGLKLSDKETMKTLVATTFKGLSEPNVKQAIVEGMLRGFTFQDFLQKNIYAIPYGEKYSLVTSIDYARKLGARAGLVGKSEPVYEMEGAKILACSVTVKRQLKGTIGDFSAKVYFAEYTTGKNLWTSKPRTMIAKVAEMHALRMACPEEMSQVYVQEEMDQRISGKAAGLEPIDIEAYGKKLEACKTMNELGKVWSDLPGEAKLKLVELKDHLKASLK